MIGFAGAAPTDQVITVGGRHLELLVDLMRRGFRRIACLRSGMPTAGEEADLVWVPRADTESDLVSAVNRLNRHLHDGGKLMVQGAGRGTQRLQSLRRWLGVNGYTVRRQMVGKAGFALFAQKSPAAALRQAA